MKYSIIFLFLLPLFASGQLELDEKAENNTALYLRGKASGFVIIEDIYFHNYNLGLEYRFAKQHSIGIDYVHFRWHFEEDLYIDGKETGSGPDAFSRRRYLLFDYRYYPFGELMKEHGIDPYLNPFVKMGRRKIWSNDPTTFYWDDDASILSQRADFSDYGFALGLRYDFGVKDRFGLDANIGAVYRETHILYEKLFDYTNDVFVERFSGNEYDWKFHMRLNFYVRLFDLK